MLHRASVIAAAATATFAAPAPALEPDQLFQKVSPSVVTVVSLHDAEGKSFGFGSGVVIAPQTVITNCHVLQKGKSILVKAGKEVSPAKLMHPDVKRDLCQLSVPEITAPAVEIGSVSRLRVGQRVYAIGNPRQLDLTLSDGIISGLRDIEDGAPLIQTTAPISPGSSGGGLFDSDGRLIGITTWQRRDSQNLNFAHPADWIAEVPRRAAEQLSTYREQVASAKPSTPSPAPAAPPPAATGRVPESPRPSPVPASPPATSRLPEPPASSPAPAAPAESLQPAQVAAAVEQILTGRDLVTLFSSNRDMRVNGQGGLNKLIFRPNGWVTAEFTINIRGGTHRIDTSSNQVCLEFRSAGAAFPYQLNDCFTVSRLSDRQYRLTSTDKKYVLLGEM